MTQRKYSSRGGIWLMSAFALGALSCSSSDPSGAPSDAGTSSDVAARADGGAPIDPPVVDGSGEAGAPDAATSGRGITVTAGNTTRTLKVGATANGGDNRYTVQASETDGTTLYRVTIQLDKSDATGSPVFVTPTPGAYMCSGPLPTSPFQWGRIQYAGPEGVFQFGDSGVCVTLTEFGAVGQPVKGTFSATLARVSSGTGAPSIEVSGSFDVDRAN